MIRIARIDHQNRDLISKILYIKFLLSHSKFIKSSYAMYLSSSEREVIILTHHD